MSEGSEPATPEDSRGTRDRLVKAAIEVFIDKGYGGTRVQDITKQAGLTTGALYAHFENRTALLAEALATEGRVILADMQELVGEIPPGEGRMLSVLALALTRPGEAIDRLLLEALAASARDPVAAEQLLPSILSLSDTISTQIGQAADLGIVDPDLDVDTLKHFFTCLVLGAVASRALALPSVGLEEMTALLERLRRAISDDTP